MLIGLLGGTFDPVHLGHLILAERVREEAGLDEVRFLPSFQPPHKQGVVISPFDQRLAMLERALAEQPAFRIETVERDLPSPSYTARTLTALSEKHPTAEFKLIVGADCLPDLPTWFEPQRVLEQAGLIVVPRPGVELWSATKLAESLLLPAGRISLQVVESPQIDIASRVIRARSAAGKSIRYLVPRSVESFIHQHRLYRP